MNAEHARLAEFSMFIEIAKGNPEFQYGTTARVEVSPLGAEEEITGFV